MIEYGNKHNGDCNVPRSYILTLQDKSEIKLGKLLSDQRRKYETETLHQNRLIQLQSLVDQNKLLWDATKLLGRNSGKQIKWDDMFYCLLEYGEKHNGDCNVLINYVITKSDNTIVNLGKWLHSQHKLYKSNKLIKYQKDQLQELVDAKILD